jgi:hypothetical protein
MHNFVHFHRGFSIVHMPLFPRDPLWDIQSTIVHSRKLKRTIVRDSIDHNNRSDEISYFLADKIYFPKKESFLPLFNFHS